MKKFHVVVVMLAAFLAISVVLAFAKTDSQQAIGSFSIDGQQPVIVYENGCNPLDGAYHQLEVRSFIGGFATSGRLSDNDPWALAQGTTGKSQTPSWQGWQMCFSNVDSADARQILISVDPNASGNIPLIWETEEFERPSIEVLSAPPSTTVGVPVSISIQVTSINPATTTAVFAGSPVYEFVDCSEGECVVATWEESGIFTYSLGVADWWGSFDVVTGSVSVVALPEPTPVPTPDPTPTPEPGTNQVFMPLLCNSYPNLCSFETSGTLGGFRINGGSWTQVSSEGCVQLGGTVGTIEVESHGGFATNGRIGEGPWSNALGESGIYKTESWQGWLVCFASSGSEAKQILINTDPNAGSNVDVLWESTCQETQ